MPNPSPFTNKSGTVVYRVQYRPYPGKGPTTDTFETYRQAADFCALIKRVGPSQARLLREAVTRAELEETITCRDAFTRFCEHASSYAEEGTVAKYKLMWDSRIGPTFDPWPIGQVTRQHVEAWVAKLRRTETTTSHRARTKDPSLDPQFMSPKTIANLQGLLSSVFRLQVDEGHLEKNPAHRIRLPAKHTTRPPVFLSTSQRTSLLARTPAEWQTLIALLLATGLRWGEATALAASDLDLEATPATVRVERAWKRGAQGFNLGPPKSRKSRRTITLPAQLVPELQELAGRRGTGMLFVGPDGGRLRSEWFTARVWRPAVEAAGIDPAPRIHDLRHTHASMLLGAGVPIHIVQYRMGHESIQTTVNVYGHLVPDAGRIAAEATELAMATALPQLIESAS